MSEEREDFSSWTVDELFLYLKDNLLIAPEEEFRYWKHYKEDMVQIAEEFYKEHNEFKELI